MSAGLNIKALKRKYGDDTQNGMWRFILHRDISNDTAWNDLNAKSLKMDSLMEQKFLIEKGYVGYKLNKDTQMIQYSLAN